MCTRGADVSIVCTCISVGEVRDIMYMQVHVCISPC